MRAWPLQFLTWGTILAAVLSALWLATGAPQRPFGAHNGDVDTAEASLRLPLEATAAGPAASATSLTLTHPIQGQGQVQ